jgi:hypothetical protein
LRPLRTLRPLLRRAGWSFTASWACAASNSRRWV